MTNPFRPCVSVILALCLLLAVPAFPQSGGGHIGPSSGEIIGIVVGVAAGLTVVAVLVYRQSHNHASITGCVASHPDGLTLQNEKDKKVYTLGDYTAVLKTGERVTVQGRKSKDSGGKPYFHVHKLAKDFGSCAP